MKGLKLSDIPKIQNHLLRLLDQNMQLKLSDIPKILQDSLRIDEDNKVR